MEITSSFKLVAVFFVWLGKFLNFFILGVMVKSSIDVFNEKLFILILSFHKEFFQFAGILVKDLFQDQSNS